jgi:hypothetical protein
MDSQKDDKGQTIYNDLRHAINQVSDYSIRNVFRIVYLFGAQKAELIGTGKDRQTVTGNDFYISNINDTNALLLDIKTVKGSKQKRTIAIPLNSNYEPMAELVLNYVEEIGDAPVWTQTYENLNLKMRKKRILKPIIAPVHPNKGRKNKPIEKVATLKHFAEIRELELSLCHNFNEIDLKVFNGDIASVDYHTYYAKLLKRSDYFFANDVYNSIYLKNVVFNSPTQEKYNYREYMEIQKLIKRGNIRQEPVESVRIDPNVDVSDITAGQSGGPDHKMLMKNAIRLMGSQMDNIVFEKDNLDVVDLVQKIIVECADTFARKLLGAYHNTFEEIKDMREYWILQNYKEDNQSKLYKFKFNK